MIQISFSCLLEQLGQHLQLSPGSLVIRPHSLSDGPIETLSPQPAQSHGNVPDGGNKLLMDVKQAR